MLEKMRMLLSLLLTLTLFSCSSCNEEKEAPIDETKILMIRTTEILNPSFIGNGAQWGGYELLKEWTGQDDFSESDWQKLQNRVDYMNPPFLRIMVDGNWNYIRNNSYDPSKTNDAFFRIMDYCQARDITVMFGEWGHQYLNNDRTQINQTWLGWAADYLDWLVKDKGYSCIRYFNMVNEPNGNWSSTHGNYDLWEELMILFQAELEERGLDSQVDMVGPDVAVWDAGLTDWISRTAENMGGFVELYDIHTYPEQSFVQSDDYLSMLNAYKSGVPQGKQIVMGEIGYKYYHEDTGLKQENEERIANDPYASSDCNMFVYDAFYGVDMGDALIQCMIAGYGGALVWDMDDAMYNKPDYSAGDRYDAKKLKRWGFWNILGEKVCNDIEDEAIRPFFYTVSLLCRYFPGKAVVYRVELPGKKGLRAIAAEQGGYYTIAIVNTNYVTYEDLALKADNIQSLENIKQYQYLSKQGSEFEGKTDKEGFPVPEEENITMDLTKGYRFTMQGKSVQVFTNFPF